MIKSITVTNYLGDSILLELARPEKSGFAIKSITGLGPGKANINTSKMATNDGSLFNSSNFPSRNIVITLKYLWKDTIEEARQLSYKYFPIKKKVNLLIETDNRRVEIDGYVESNDPTIFSNDECTDISIICPNPYFYSADGESSTILSGIEPMFEFPFSNESLTEPLIEFGSIQKLAERVVIYEGDLEIGVTITIHALDNVGNITIYNTGTREIMGIDVGKLIALTGFGIIAGDDIVICTVKGNKSIKLIRAGKTTNILNCLTKGSDWFQLKKGENVFAYVVDGYNNTVEFKIEHKIIYEGV